MEELTKNNIEEKIKEILNNRKLKFKYMYDSKCENDTLTLGLIFGKHLNKRTVISLNGELGSGKTVFMKGIGKYFGIEDEISSPTFTIVNEYTTQIFPLFHFDVYRLKDSENFLNTIGDEYFGSGACILEWGKIISDILPRSTINIDFKKTDNSARQIIIWRD